jgi:N-methylhydantoinase B
VEKARDAYGVVIDPDTFEIDNAATEELRKRLKQERGEPKPFDFGPPLEEILAKCKEETGLEPPKPPVFRKFVPSLPLYKPQPTKTKVVYK